jgi:hypothetical protein
MGAADQAVVVIVGGWGLYRVLWSLYCGGGKRGVVVAFPPKNPSQLPLGSMSKT